MTSFPLTFPKNYQADAPAGSPLTPAHFQELELANKRSKKIRRAINVAKSDAWIAAIFASLTLLSGFMSPVALLLGLALGFCAFNSFRGVKLLERYNPSALKLLALNQLLLAGIIIAYGAWSLYQAKIHPSAILDAGGAGADVQQALDAWKPLVWIIYLAIYGGLIAATAIAQPLTALYYYSRKKILLGYLAETPAWILELQKSKIGG